MKSNDNDGVAILRGIRIEETTARGVGRRGAERRCGLRLIAFIALLLHPAPALSTGAVGEALEEISFAAGNVHLCIFRHSKWCAIQGTNLQR